MKSFFYKFLLMSLHRRKMIFFGGIKGQKVDMRRIRRIRTLFFEDKIKREQRNDDDQKNGMSSRFLLLHF